MVGAVNKRARLLGAFYNLILLFSSLVFGFIIIEGALWLLNTPPHPETIFEGNAVDKKNGFVLRPNTVSRHSSWEFDTEVSVNEMGFRGEASVKPNTALFAMMLGGSFLNCVGNP